MEISRDAQPLLGRHPLDDRLPGPLLLGQLTLDGLHPLLPRVEPTGSDHRREKPAGRVETSPTSICSHPSTVQTPAGDRVLFSEYVRTPPTGVCRPARPCDEVT